MTLAELCRWWLKNRCPIARAYNEEKRLQKPVFNSDLGKLALPLVTADAIETQLRQMDKAGKSTATINGLRGVLRTVYSRARKAGMWLGPNPVADVEPRRVSRKIHETLRADEMPVLMPHVPKEWRHLFATALLTGIRKGELL